MTTRYRTERLGGKTKRDAVETALTTSMPSIIVSALCFFAATFGVGLYSDVDIISSMCNLIARGALVSMASVIFVLPSGLHAARPHHSQDHPGHDEDPISAMLKIRKG